MRELALFAGAGGGILGGHLLGWRTVAAVEIEEYPRAVLLQRQADGILPRFPIWDDVCTFDGKPWRGKVDVISGGFPCQDISAAGKGAGITGERSGLWSEMARIIGEVRPGFVFVENSPVLTIRGIGTVLGDLASLGYDAQWGVLGADDAGAPHSRKRIWILAHAGEMGRDERADQPGEELREARGGFPCIGSDTLVNAAWWDIDPADLPDTGLPEPQTTYQQENPGPRESRGDETRRELTPSDSRTAKSRVGRVAHGVAHRVDRLKAIGNGQVPAVAALAWKILNRSLKDDFTDRRYFKRVFSADGTERLRDSAPVLERK